MNPNYAAKVKDEIDKLLRVGFIQPVKWATWLSPIVVVPKKNGKIRVCVDYHKINVATVTDGFPLPFKDSVLDMVAGHECYSFLDGFSGYNKIRMHPDDQEKKTFVTEWGVFVAEVMMFDICHRLGGSLPSVGSHNRDGWSRRACSHPHGSNPLPNRSCRLCIGRENEAARARWVSLAAWCSPFVSPEVPSVGLKRRCG